MQMKNIESVIINCNKISSIIYANVTGLEFWVKSEIFQFLLFSRVDHSIRPAYIQTFPRENIIYEIMGDLNYYLI